MTQELINEIVFDLLLGFAGGLLGGLLVFFVFIPVFTKLKEANIKQWIQQKVKELLVHIFYDES